ASTTSRASCDSCCQRRHVARPASESLPSNRWSSAPGSSPAKCSSVEMVKLGSSRSSKVEAKRRGSSSSASSTMAKRASGGAQLLGLAGVHRIELAATDDARAVHELGIEGGELLLDDGEIACRVGIRVGELDQMQQHAAALDVLEELDAEPGPLRRAGDEARQ